MVTTSPSPISPAMRSTRQERWNSEPRRAIGYSRGTTSTLWLNTSGRSAMTLASGISWPWKSGVEHLELAVGRLAAHLADHADERRGALVGQVVAVDGGDDGVAQAHARDRARDARGLERVVPGRLAGLDVAEAAAARARVAEDHERGGAALPALADVGAGGLLADGVQVLRADQLGQLAVALPAGGGHLEPGRLALAQRAHVGAEHAQHVHAARLGARSRGAHAGTASARRRRFYGRRHGGGYARGMRSVDAEAPRGDESLAPSVGEAEAVGHLLAKARQPRCDGRAGLGGDRGHLHVGQPAGHDPGERLQVVVDVDGETVRR